MPSETREDLRQWAERATAATSEAAQYRALRESVGLRVTPAWAPILVEGEDALSYLHRRLTRSIKNLELGRGLHALQLEGDGRMQAEFLVYRGQDSFLLLTPLAEVETAWEPLEKFTLMDDVQVTRMWEGESVLGLAGPAAAALLSETIDQRGAAEVLARDAWHGLMTVTIAGFPARVFGDGRWGVPYFHVCVPGMALQPAAQALHEAAMRAGGLAVGEGAIELLRIEAGVMLHGVDTNARTIPLDAGLYGAIDFDKGCYPGQEFMARINNLGHPARVPVRLMLHGEHPLEPGSAIWVEGAESGSVSSSACISGLDRTAALGYFKWDAQGAERATVQTAQGAIQADVVKIGARA